MGRKKKIKTDEEQINYQKRRREQNRINQKNFRLRRKLLKQILEISNQEKNQKYREGLTLLLKKQEFNYFITLTTKEERTLRHIKIIFDNFISKLKLDIGIEGGYFVVETSNRPHIHLLVKTNSNLSNLIKSIGKNWNEGFTHTKNITSGIDNLILENYVTKEVYYNSPEVNWEMF